MTESMTKKQEGENTMTNEITTEQAKKLLPVESKYQRTGYVLDPDSDEMLVMCPRGRSGDGQVIVLPYKVVREIAKIAEVWCG